ncbi:MAG: TrmH family RNA methyltransferase, partial [Pirellulaceae bacterium]|nr:TrmH family RNA methyltransferase [Pirellulaceae bacterium]
EEVASVCAAAQRAGGSIFALPAHLFEKIEYGSRGQGLVATAATPERPLHAFTPRERSGEHDFFAVVDRLEKPGNLGAILRTADAAGAGGLIATDGATDLFNPNAIRSSLGSVFQLPAAVAAADDVVEWLTARNTTILAARVDAATPISAVDLRRPVAIVLGSESAGLGDAWRRKCVTPVTLPMRGSVDSLNVSAAAAAMFYEVVRQRLT